MRFRLRTLLILLALAPPLVAVAVLGLERTYFGVAGRFRRMFDHEPVKRTKQEMPELPPAANEG